MRGKHFAIIALVTAMTFAFVWVRLRIVSTSYDINTLSKQERSLREECNTLSLKINEAKSPRRLEQLAATKFKMGPPRPGQVVLLEEK
ncbi:MAG: cell division protein FtsL [Bdellovibrionota bacterium]